MKMVAKWLAVVIMVLAAGMLVLGCGGEDKKTPETGGEEVVEPIKIAGMVDLSGPTSEVGNPYAEGLKAATDYINELGGINGRPIQFMLEDTGYKTERGQDLYSRFVFQENVVAIQGFGTAVTQDLKASIASDKIPNFSASYSADLTDPKQAPYNFFIATDYSTQLRCALKFFKDNWTEDRAPKVAFVYPDHPYGKSPIAAAKAYAEELGYELVGEENVSLGAKEADANPAIIRLKKAGPDFVWIGGTTKSTAAICKSAKANGFETSFFVNIWGCDEDLVRLAGDAAEGVYSNQAAAVWGADVPGMKLIEASSNGQPVMTHYIRGFTSMLVLAEGLKLAEAGGELTGESVKAALETLNDFDTMGLTPKITYAAGDHRPNMGVFITQIQDGKLVIVEQVNLERRADWLGF